MAPEPEVLEIYETGPVTVVGFGGRKIIQELNLAPLHDEILQLVETHNCRELAFDLTGVQFVPSGLLGILASLQKKGIKVHIYNPSDDIRDVFRTTRLDTVVEVHDLEV